MQPTEHTLDQPRDHHERQRHHIEVRRDGEDGARFPDAAQIPEQHEQRDRDGYADGDGVGRSAGNTDDSAAVPADVCTATVTV